MVQLLILKHIHTIEASSPIFFSSLQLSIFAQMYLYASEVHFELATFPWEKLSASMGKWALVSDRIKQMLKSSTLMCTPHI